MNPGALPYSKVRYVTLLRHPFHAHSSPNYPWKVCSVTQRSQVFWIFDQKLQICHTMNPTFLIFWIENNLSLFKIYETFHKFPSELVT